MGNKISKSDEEQIDFSRGTYKAMDKKMGPWYHVYVPFLQTQYGFNGGLSVSHLTQTKANWSTHVVKKKDKEHHKKCGEVIEKWLEEATRRQRKQVRHAIAPLISKQERQDASKKAHLPPPRNPDQVGGAAGGLGHRIPNAPPETPPKYSPPEDKDEDEASSTRSGASYSAKPDSQQQNVKRGRVKKIITDRQVFKGEGEDDGAEALQPLMLEVAGPAGPNLVMPLWTHEELKEAFQHMPDIEEGGAKLGAELAVFCQVLRPTLGELWKLMVLKYGPLKMAKLSAKWPEYPHLQHITYTHVNNDYTGKVKGIITALSELFPRKIDLRKVRQCTQEKDESTETYFERLQECFDRYGGIDKRPPRADQQADPYDYYLKTSFMDGLDSDISKAIQKSCVEWQLASTAEIRRHAEHHEDIIKEQRKTEAAKQYKDLMVALKTMQVMHMGGGNPYYHQQNQRGRGRNFQQQRQKPYDPDLCFKCGQNGHWRNDCPKGYNRDQAD